MTEKKVKPKEGVTVKLDPDVIKTVRDLGAVRGQLGISPMIEMIIEKYIKDHALTTKEEEVLKFLRQNETKHLKP